MYHEGSPVLRREMRTMAPGGTKEPFFQSPPRPRHDDGPHLQEYKQHLLNSLKKRAKDVGEERAERDYVEKNKDRTTQGASPVKGVRYVWTDDGRPSPRLPASDYIRAEAYDYSGSGKKRMWNPQHERYMDFVTARGVTAYEDSDLNMLPEGKMRR